MKHLLVATGVFLLPAAIHAQEPKIQCPGENTMEMRYCAGQSWGQSQGRLKVISSRARCHASHCEHSPDVVAQFLLARVN
jgi:hypothetical protein